MESRKRLVCVLLELLGVTMMACCEVSDSYDDVDLKGVCGSTAQSGHDVS